MFRRAVPGFFTQVECGVHYSGEPSGVAGATLLKPGESAGMPGVIITGEKNKMISQGLTLRNFRLTHHLACADG